MRKLIPSMLISLGTLCLAPAALYAADAPAESATPPETPAAQEAAAQPAQPEPAAAPAEPAPAAPEAAAAAPESPAPPPAPREPEKPKEKCIVRQVMTNAEIETCRRVADSEN
jgi:hypothetical protein